jgi:hypothetical protein
MSALGGEADMTFAEIRFRGRYKELSGHGLLRHICLLLTQSGHGCRSERVPGRLRCEFEVADIGAEPQSDA